MCNTFVGLGSILWLRIPQYLPKRHTFIVWLEGEILTRTLLLPTLLKIIGHNSVGVSILYTALGRWDLIVQYKSSGYNTLLSILCSSLVLS